MARSKMERSLLAIFLIAVLSSLGNVALAFAEGRPAESMTLANGLKVVLKDEPYGSLVALELWIGAGSADEEPGQAGIAHVVEHILFRGSSADTGTKLAGQMEGLGARMNAFTARDQTVFHVVLPAPQLYKGLRFLAQMIQLPVPEQARFSKEIQVVLQEWEKGQDDPRARATVSLFKLVYGGHPYGRPVLGTPATLKQLTWHDVSRFYQSWYMANNMTLVVVGNFSSAPVKSEIEHLFSLIPQAPLPPRKRPVLTVQSRPRISVINTSARQARLLLGFPIPPGSDPQTLPLDLLAFILGRGETSRLAQSVKIERGLVNAISASASTRKGPGIFIVRAETEPGKILDALRAILGEVYRLREQPVEPSELSRAMANFHRFFVESKETVQRHARRLGRFQRRYGTPNYEASYLSALGAIGPDALSATAQQFLTTDKLSVALVIPEGRAAELDALDLEKMSLEAEIKFSAPATTAQDRVVKAILDNGLRVVIQENSRLPLVAMHAAATGGLAAEDSRNNGIHNFIVSMLTKGTAHFTGSRLAHDVEQLAGTMRGSTTYSAVNFSAIFPEQEQVHGLELFLDALFHSSFPEESLEKTRQEILHRIKNDEERLRSRATRLFYQSLFATHPYRRSLLGRPDIIAGFSRQDLLDRYRELFSPDRTVLAIVGRVNAERVLRRITERLAPLTAHGSQFRAPAVESPPHEKRVEKLTIKAHQTHLVLGFLGPPQGEADYFAMKVTEAILSPIGGRLFRDLRDDKGLAYSVRAFTLESPLQGAFAVYAATEPARFEEMKEGILAELRRLQEVEVPEDEIRRAKTYLLGSYENRRQTDSAKAADLALRELFGSSADPQAYRQGIQGVTPERVQAFARRYFLLNRYTLAVLGP
jgi:zinc protease